MILSFISEYDNSARSVIDWLHYFNPSLTVKVITEHSDFHPLEVEISNDLDRVYLGDFNLKEIVFYYYRRGVFKSFIHENMEILDYGSKEWLKKEEECLFEYSENILKLRDCYGSLFLEKRTNKLLNLQLAKKSGFAIPKTLVTTSKNKLIELYKSSESGVIVKPISDHRPLMTKRGVHFIPRGTKKITWDSIIQLEEQFFPTLFQEYIEKKYEIRVFFYNELIYAMAIFSQSNDTTRIDFRNYDRELPNRCVPFSLPSSLKHQVLEFSKLSGYDTGSIDILKCTSNNYYFLEINYSGQYEWLSENCNYYIDRQIANYINEKIKN